MGQYIFAAVNLKPSCLLCGGVSYQENRKKVLLSAEKPDNSIDDADNLTNRKIENYLIEKENGRGGRDVIYLAGQKIFISERRLNIIFFRHIDANERFAVDFLRQVFCLFVGNHSLKSKFQNCEVHFISTQNLQLSNSSNRRFFNGQIIC